MIILVQSGGTELFQAKSGGWTAKQEGARSFSDSRSAIEHCFEHEIFDAKFLYVFTNRAMNFTISPFTDEPPDELKLHSALRDSVLFVTRSLVLRKKNATLRKALDNLMAEGKETRKKISFRRIKGPPGEQR